MTGIPQNQIDLAEVAWSEMACALFIRACADYRGRIDHSEGDPRVIAREAQAFLMGETPEWLESKRFWLRVSGLDEHFFDTVILPRLLSEDTDLLDKNLLHLREMRKP